MTPTEPGPTRFPIKVGIVVIAIIAYPLIAHLSLLAGQRFVGLAFATGLGVLLLWSQRHRGPVVLLCVAVAVVIAVAAVATSRVGDLVYLPPIVITLLLFWIFARTLRPGRTPLVTALARMARGELDPRVAAYTRGVTMLWAGFLLLMTVELILLAAFAPIELWSLFANGVNYGLIVGLFLAEYVFRRIYLSDVPHAGFMQYLKFIRRTNLMSANDQTGRDP